SQGLNNLNAGGICYNNSGSISGCKNFGSFEFTGQELIVGGGGICGHANGPITNCQNYANLSGKIDNLGGIAGSVIESAISNCSNYGIIDGRNNIGGIVGDNFSWSSSVNNCFNSGNIYGIQNVAGIFGNRNDDTITNCLNVGLCYGSAITCLDTTGLLTNNYYDKQMCLSKGIDSTDISGSAEGKLTTQLTGTSPELQAMLGDGWSYAEGRYPIPLGLENDSLALVAATPVYLHFETEEDYNHVDSVSKNFTVGLENNVSWEQANGRVSFSDESVTLINLGFENITVNLGDYSKKVRINIVDIETFAPIQTVETEITAYPNPAGEFISLNLNGINAERVDVYDITGKLLSTNNLSSEQTLIFTGNLHSGSYFIKVYNGNQNIAILKIIKR
ncbi:MAG: T9SS type A sorting domain-containing protein, partial [Bacteroidales bacterium]|nr:T9SS type A sorting domain-containing protein [Bacteroidales bacterium]